MEEEKILLSDIFIDTYDALERPFDFMELSAESALVCESDPALRTTLSEAMKEMGYITTEVTTAKDALKNLRFHTYSVIVVNEKFDSSDVSKNAVLHYLAHMNMSTRRDIFVVMISETIRTMDTMEAYNKSVNLIINTSNLNDFSNILKHAKSEHEAFYHVFKETLKKKGII